ncbi:prenyltransferase/squalene oxidase repeat-containing protein [Kroppenstedtia eburnea]|uniref:Sporulenol synthase n=1 Tax=Kroppenstedtia eburnea TaxID=714067 RepID=A0A1N7M318_9BACL|nr:prenyltransferase/squalene oxidase repeat-containing protein [Kroppenstedtia eburnea]EGK14829.1 squalene--hopene cyclase [Desmospora sp. 8437]SIS80474.1 sporulenol synthase [Kroppenstedtia eburnea]
MQRSPEHLQAAANGANQMIGELTRQQQTDGRWIFCFESGVMSDAYMLLLYEIFGTGRREYREGMAQRLLSLSDNGIWRSYPDEKGGSVTATLEASIALVAAGYKELSDPLIQNSQAFVREQGGMAAAGSLTRVAMILTGLHRWPDNSQIPIKLFLLPWWFPINFFDFVGFTRVHVAPILLASNRKFSVRLPRGPRDLALWNGEGGTSHDSARSVQLEGKIDEFLPHLRLSASGGRLDRLVEERGLRFILDRIEPDGTLYSYFSTTFLMIFALMAMGYRRDHPVILRAISGLERFYLPVKGGLHLQETTSTVWDTALISYALQEAGMTADDPVIQKAGGYLLSRQQTRLGDWALRNPGVAPGGWGFSDINTINPDVDDTSYNLRALGPLARMNRQVYQSWARGARWELSMQNRDGGWSAFEKNTDKKWPKILLPKSDAQTVWTDPSTADLTGRTLEWVGNHLGWKRGHPVVDRAASFLVKNQEPDGSWFGRWGINYIYGTWAALTGLTSVGFRRGHPAIDKGVQWLLSVQHEDGGWGESCNSDVVRKYVPLKMSTPVQTAWAVDALVAVHDAPTPAIEAGVHRLLQLCEHPGEPAEYPTGGGLSGQFYIYYHSYRYVWPLTALSHYRRKYAEK